MNTMDVELQEIKTCLSILKEHHDITYYGLEADAINILILLAKHKYNNRFEFVCHCISETPAPNENYRESISYLLSCINNEKHRRNNRFIGVFDDWHIKILELYK
jgi:hypothetical protein